MPQREISLSSATTALTQPELVGLARSAPVPGLVLAFSPPELLADDRAPLLAPLTVGRSSSCSWCLRDKKLSREHLRLTPTAEGRFLLRDLESRNGVSVDGARVESAVEVSLGSVIRAGGCVFVVVADLGELAPQDVGAGEHEMAGRFHSFALLRRLRIAARSGQAVLLDGESGVGKELAARALHRSASELGRAGPFLAHNAACYAGEDDAVGTLFGVNRGAFTGVEARTGALEQAQGGTLFLDEVHALPLRVQRSLLRFVEDGLLQPLGQAPTGAKVAGGAKALDVRLIFGTNLDVERACEEGQLAHDLVARLDRVHLTPLRERRADVPSLLAALLDRTLTPATASQVLGELRAEAIERLCAHDYRQGNVRELLRLASLCAARIAEGEPSRDALAAALRETLCDEADPACASKPPPLDGGSQYERHREEILAVYHEVGGNLSRMEALLRQRGVPSTRRWLAIFLDRWGVRPIPRRG